jgi:hypothetical protein
MEAKTISVVKHPRDLVWSTMRDRLAEIAAHVQDVESAQLVERREHDDVATVVHVWQASPKLPAIIASRVQPEMFRWNDHALWDARSFTCTWRIEPHHFADYIQCHGITTYEPAIGGRGTRITFTSDFHLGRGDGRIASPLLSAAEPFFRGIIPKNFQKIVASLAALLDRETCRGSC